MNGEPPADHKYSHQGLLRRPLWRTSRSLDAIVVSAARDAANLRPAIELADELAARLVVLASGATDLADAEEYAWGRSRGEFWFVDVSAYQPPADLRFDTDHREVDVPRLGDLSRKRNLALYLAQRCGWDSVMLLDDDIRELSARMVRDATELLPKNGLVGMIAQDFPDNSVVCHAARLAGEPQRVFISGSALIIDTTRIDSFFPEVYNEDWLFMHERIRHRRASASGNVRQLAYSPYLPGRAAGEEFGDTLAEGLVGLLHGGQSFGYARRRDWWESALAARRQMLERIGRELPSGAARDAVSEALEQHRWFGADFFANYVKSWQAENDKFRARLRRHEGNEHLDDVLLGLELPASVKFEGEQLFEPGGMVGQFLPAPGAAEAEFQI